MMPIHELAQLTWEEVRDLDRGRTLVVLPVGAMEAHGPHLPLSTDIIIANAMAESGARKLSKRGHSIVVLPQLIYAPATFAAEFPGTVSVSAASLTALVLDLARSLSRQGFRLLAIANAHLDPEHLTALYDAVKLARQSGMLPIVFPDLTRKPWGSRLGDEFRSGACHAGQFETSIVLRAKADAVRDKVRQALAPNPQSLSKAIKAGKQTFAEAGGPRAYFGDPAAATPEEGSHLVEALGSVLEDAVMEAIK